VAGDWIKMRANLHTHPKVVRMSSALSADRLRIVGGLHAVWCLFDEHSEDGRLDGYSSAAIDDHIGFPGFAQAMQRVHWLTSDTSSVALPEFDKHNGQSAKRRAMDADRKREKRAENAPEMSAPKADKKRTREEKRREDISPLFERFYEAYPRKVGRKAAEKAFAKVEADEALVDRMVSAIQRQGLKAKCAKGDAQYVPHPSTWLSEGRWDDEDGAPANDDPYGLKKAVNYVG
jgi:hypothetical protein